jgi:hypothetical protein
MERGINLMITQIVTIGPAVILVFTVAVLIYEAIRKLFNAICELFRS